MAGSILGTRVQRKEDPKFLTTGGVYVDDLTDELLQGAAQVAYARSAVAHGTISAIEIEPAAPESCTWAAKRPSGEPRQRLPALPPEFGMKA